MADYDHLSNFLSELEDDGDLVRVPVVVDPDLELAEIADRLRRSSADGGPAVLFERVKGSPLPVIANLLGSRKRMCRALRIASLDDATTRLEGLLQPELPDGWMESMKLVPQLSHLGRLPPKTVKSGLCQQVVKMGRDVDLRELPLVRSWPGDKAPAITAGQIYTTNPHSGARDVGTCPVQVSQEGQLLLFWTGHQEGYRNFVRYRQAQRQMPVAVVLGGDPVLTYVAHAPRPAYVEPCLFAAFLRGSSIEMVRCRSVDLEVPAHAEVVIEGLIDVVAEPQAAGPLGLPTGFYSLPESLPPMQVTALTHRSNPLFPAIIAGRLAGDEFWIGKAAERMLLPFVQMFLPEVVDIDRPRPGLHRNLLFVSIRKRYPQQARKVMNALWGIESVMTTKIIVVVDAHVDVHNEEQVWWHVGANVHPGRDVIFCEGPTDMHDHAAPVRGMGNKMGIDATQKRPDEGHPRPWPELLQMDERTSELVSRRWPEYGLGGP